MTRPHLPNQSPEIDRFIAALDHPMAANIAGLRLAILASNPAITEHIKWNAPSFLIDGDDRVTFRLPSKGGFQMIFHRGVRVRDSTGFTFTDPTGLMRWAAPDRATVTLPDTAALEGATATIVSLVGRWMAATRDAGSSAAS